MNQGSILKAALLGGILAGVISSVPFISLLCCVWALGGGGFAAWALNSDAGGQAGAGRCATAGFLAGLIGGAICAPLTGLINRLVHGVEGLQEQAEQAAAMMGSGQELPPEMMEALMRGTSFIEFNVWSLVAILFMSVVFSLLGLLGGLVGGAVFGRTPPAPPAGALPVPPPVVPEAGAAPESATGELPPDELPVLPPRDED